MQIIFGFFLLLLVFALLFFFLKKQMEKEFKTLSYDLLQKNAKTFFDLASTSLSSQQEKTEKQIEGQKRNMESLLAPLKESLIKLSEETSNLERKRERAYTQLEMQMQNMMRSEELLRKETATLAKALQSPNIRGSWGQLHLKRVVELAGLLENCDFYEQQSTSFDGKLLRPDLVIHLPGERQIVVDAKTPFDAFVKASQEENESIKKEKLLQHAKHLRKHVQELASKEYWKHFSSVECVILFLPAEGFFSAALQIDPQLLEQALASNILVATPTSLLGILRSIAHTWKQDALSKNAEIIAEMGSELYDRLLVMHTHFEKLGKNMQSSIEAYNQVVSSMESRVFVSGRKLQEFMHKQKEIKELQEINTLPKNVKIP